MKQLKAILLQVICVTLLVAFTASVTLANQAADLSPLEKRIQKLVAALKEQSIQDTPVRDQKRLQLALSLAQFEKELTTYPRGDRWIRYFELAALENPDADEEAEKSLDQEVGRMLGRFEAISKNPTYGRVAALPAFRTAKEAIASFVKATAKPTPAEPVTTEPAATEPAPTEPASTEPVTTEPATTEPATTEPAPTEPATTEPAPTEPATTEPATTEPATTEPAPTEPAPTEPAPTEPAPTEPVTTEPVTTEPATTEPVTTEPLTTEPVTTEPATTEPATTEPATSEPATTEPATTEPVTTEPVTTEPATTKPATTKPATTEPVTTEPVTTEPVTTEPVTTEPETTEPTDGDRGEENSGDEASGQTVQDTRSDQQPNAALPQSSESTSAVVPSQTQNPSAGSSGSPMDMVALVVIVLLMIAITAAIVVLGSLPLKIARQRNHPYPDAVNAASWIGLATGVFWPVAFIWAFFPMPSPGKTSATSNSTGKQKRVNDVAVLQDKVTSLKAQITELQLAEKAGV